MVAIWLAVSNIFWLYKLNVWSILNTPKEAQQRKNLDICRVSKDSSVEPFPSAEQSIGLSASRLMVILLSIPICDPSCDLSCQSHMVSPETR
jgi:hypothetical protein